MTETLAEAERAFEKLITPLPEEFVSAGLQFLAKRESSISTGDFALFVFNNPVARTSLKISLDETGILNVHVSKEGQQTFTLDSYLTHHNRNDEYRMEFILSSDPAKFLVYLKTIIATEWLDILQGKRWENIPFDWTDFG
jgi:hypothetical protein